jgi:hypothetical protein
MLGAVAAVGAAISANLSAKVQFCGGSGADGGGGGASSGGGGAQFDSSLQCVRRLDDAAPG